MPISINFIEYYLPERIIDNAFLTTQCGIEDSFLKDKIGISERHIAGDNESTSDMSYQAAQKLIEKHSINKDSIGLLIVCTQNPDYKLPTTACILQHRLGLSNNCMAFDINLGCSGYVYALKIANGMMQDGKYEHGLLVMADQYSKLINLKDKNTAALFGDAASATLVSKCEQGLGCLDFELGTDGSGANHLIANNSGVCHNDEAGKFLYMNGREIFKFSVNIVPKNVTILLQRNGLQMHEIHKVIFHQANKYMLRELQKKLSIRDDQMVLDFERYGNTVSSTIPIALGNLSTTEPIPSGKLIILTGFGVGLSWGSVLYKTK